MRHKVIMMLDRLGGGGIAQVVINTAVELDKSRFDPVVLTTRTMPKMNHGDLLADAGVRLVELDRNSRYELRAWAPLLRELKSTAILHSHGTETNQWAKLFGFIKRVPVIITHNHIASDQKPKHIQMLDRYTSFMCNAIVDVSEYDRQKTIINEKQDKKKITMIYNGIVPENFSPTDDKSPLRETLGISSEKFVISMVARLAPQKNHAVAFEALSKLPDKIRDNTLCLIIGEGSLETDLRNLRDKLNLSSMIKFMGQRDDVPKFLQISDLMLLTSTWECLPISILEAMATGCPVISTPVGGVPETLQGIDWPLASCSDALVTRDAIVKLYEMNKSERISTAEKARNRIETVFSASNSVKEVQSLYHTLLKH